MSLSTGYTQILVGLLRDVQQHTHAGQGNEQRRAAVGDEGQRNTFGRHHAQHHADVNERLHHNHGRDASRQETGEGVVGAHGAANAASEKDAKQYDHQHRSPQTQLFGNVGVDEIGVRLGEVEEFLLAFHQPCAHDSAGADRDHGLDDMKAVSLRVFPGIEERDDAVPAPGHANDQDVEREQRDQEAVQKESHLHARDVEHGGSNRHASHGGAEVGLFDDEQRQQNARRGGGKQDVLPVGDVLPAGG